MTMLKFAAGALAAATLAAAVPASAATAVFNFGTDGTLDTGTNPYTYSATNSGLTVSAYAYNNLSSATQHVHFASAADVTRNNVGLGVAGNRSGEINDNGILSLGEGILLVFNQSVDLRQALFGNFGSGDSVRFEWGSPIASGETLDLLNVSGGQWNGSNAFTGTQFFFAANSALSSPSFRLSGVTVDFADLAGGVPEPSTWALMILGFGVIGSAMRKRQQPKISYAF